MSRPGLPDAAPAAIRSQVRDAVGRAWAAAVASGALPDIEPALPRPAVVVERPANPAFGDLATNLAMQLARPLRKAPMDIAEALAAALRDGPDASLFASAEVARPGFVNVRVADAAYESTIATILAAPAEWGRIPPLAGRRVNVEFVSANPTGPLTVGNARGAFVGDLLCRVLEAGGQEVTREYYFNDAGAQISNLGASVVALRRHEDLPEEAYRGAYVGELADALPDDVWAAAQAPGADAADLVGRWAASRVRAGIEASLEHLGVHFDVWKSEGSLHDEGWVERAVERLRAGGHVYEQDGAVWFRSTAFGDDKDRVIYRSDGRPTYFAADIGYVTEKLSRGFDHLIYIWGGGPPRDGGQAPERRPGDGLRPGRRRGAALLLGPVRARRRRGLDVEASRRVHHPRRAAGRGRRRRRALVLRLTRGDDRDRLRHRAGEEAVGREPGLLRPVRACAHRVDPAQGRRGRPDAGSRRLGPPGRRTRGAARPRGGSLPRGRGGRRRRPGDAGDHRLRHRARDAVPRLLPRRPGRRPGSARALGASDSRSRSPRRRPWPTRWACWGSPRPRRCSRRQPARPRTFASRPSGVVAVGDEEHDAVGRRRQHLGAPARGLELGDHAAEGGRELARVRRRIPAGVEHDAHLAVRAADERDAIPAPAGGRRVADASCRRRRRRGA